MVNNHVIMLIRQAGEANKEDRLIINLEWEECWVCPAYEALWKRKPGRGGTLRWRGLYTPSLIFAGWLLAERRVDSYSVKVTLLSTGTNWSPAAEKTCRIMSWAAKPEPHWGLVEWRESWIYRNLEEAEQINLYTHHIPTRTNPENRTRNQ